MACHGMFATLANGSEWVGECSLVVVFLSGFSFSFSFFHHTISILFTVSHRTRILLSTFKYFGPLVAQLYDLSLTYSSTFVV